MKKNILIVLSFIYFSSWAQTTRDLATELWITHDSITPSVTLHWVADANNSGYKIYRKLKTYGKWGKVLKSLPASATSYTDTGAKNMQAFEYFVSKTEDGFGGGGYIYAGMEIPQNDYRGRLILLVAKNTAASLSNEIRTLIMDLTGDGWMVHRFDIDSNAVIDSVKNNIKNIYTLYPGELKAVFILGHVPVPYSGNINPDAHPNHKGAWPCDGWYGDVVDDDQWTDVSVNTDNNGKSIPYRAKNKNTQGDGKFDQDAFPTDLELQVGRVDLYDMPAFSQSETELLRLYLNKNHEYRQKIFVPVMKGVIDDNFGFFKGEAFAQNAWKNFASLIGDGNYISGKWFETLDTMPCIWSYACNGGYFQGFIDYKSTDSFLVHNPKGTFNMFFGSYFGDWDETNNFLRAPLAAPTSRVLTNVLAGRPSWFFHHMGLGENIGYSALLTQNNTILYGNDINQYYSGESHIALMGDPSLRMYMLDGADTVNIVSKTHGGAFVNLSWNASTDNVAGYMVYRSTDSINGKYFRINKNLVTGTTYSDTRPAKGKNYYMVRPFRLEQTPSGSFYNLGQGAFSTAVVVDSLDYQGIDEKYNNIHTAIYPNPTHDKITISLQLENKKDIAINIYDATGKRLENKMYKNILSLSENFDLSALSTGIYFIQFSGENIFLTEKLVVK